MSNHRAISILGCGWLGFPLGQHLLSLGFNVKGSTTTPQKLNMLKDAGIEPYLLDLSGELKSNDIRSFLNSSVLFLNIPFKRSLPNPGIYFGQILSIVKAARRSPVEFVIFASSTSIYPDSVQAIAEDTAFKPADERAQVLKDVEDTLLRQKKFQATIIRFGGLYGEGRHPGKFFLKGHRNTIDDGPVNLIHLDDGVEIISRIILLNLKGQVFNAVSDAHPLRSKLYVQAAQDLNMPLPEFNSRDKLKTKVVDNSKLKRFLKYNFKYPDPLTGIPK